MPMPTPLSFSVSEDTGSLAEADGEGGRAKTGLGYGGRQASLSARQTTTGVTLPGDLPINSNQSQQNLSHQGTDYGRHAVGYSEDYDEGSVTAQTPLLAFNNDLDTPDVNNHHRLTGRSSRRPALRGRRDDSPASMSSSDYDDVFMPISQRRSWSLPIARKQFDVWYRSTIQPHIRYYLLTMLWRLVQLFIVFGVLMGVLIWLKYSGFVPHEHDFSKLNFHWEWKPETYLRPYDTGFQYNVAMDTHVHTISSDGRMSHEQVIQWALANGYNAIAVVDHNTVKGAKKVIEIAREKYANNITIIPGMEYSCCRIHMNFYGITQDVKPTSSWPTDDEIQVAIAKVHALGGIVSVNHIPWSNSTEYGYQVPTLQAHPSREQLRDWGVDAFEVINGGTFDLATLQFARVNNLIALTGTDLHHPTTPAHSWTLLNVQARHNGRPTASEIINHIIERRPTSFFFDATGSAPRAYPVDNTKFAKYAPLVAPDYFGYVYTEQRGMYSFVDGFCHPQKFALNRWPIVWTGIWIVVGWAFYEMVRAIIVIMYILFWSKKRRGNRLRL